MLLIFIFLFYNNSCKAQKNSTDTSDFENLRIQVKDQDFFIHLDSNDEYAYIKRADCKNQLKDFKGALEDYTRAINLPPDFLTYY